MEKRWGREWRKRVKMLAQLCTPTYEMWSEVFPTGPEETLSRLRSLVGRTWIDPKTIRHFPVRRIIFFFPSPNNQSKRKRSKNRHVHRSQKSGEGDFYLFFVVCIVHEASRSIDKHNILTDIPLSSCIVRTSFFLLFFIFYFLFFLPLFPFRRKLDVFGSSNNVKYVCVALRLRSKG